MPPRPLLPTFEYQTLISQVLPNLLAARPKDILDILTPHLRHLAAREAQGAWFILRSCVEDSGQDPADLPANQLINGVRDALTKITDVHPDAALRRIEAFLRDGPPIFRRIALYVLTERPQFLGFVEPQLILMPSIADQDSYHERMTLIGRRFALLPASVKQTIRQTISQGMDEAFADTRGAERSSRLARVLVTLIPRRHLSNDMRRWRTGLEAQFGSLERPTSLVWVSGVRSATAAASPDDLRARFQDVGIEGLLQALRSPRDFFTHEWYASEDLVWDSLASLIQQSPESYLPLADLLMPEDFPAAWRYFDAYTELAKEAPQFGWHRLLTAARRIVADDESNTSIWSCARLIHSAAWNRISQIDTDDFQPILAVATDILNRGHTRLDQFESIERDLTTHQLNTPAGMASDAIIGVSFRYTVLNSTEAEQKSDFPERTRMSPAVAALLARSVLEGWGGIEMRHSIGQHLFLLLWADPEWLNRQIDRLLPPKKSTDTDIGSWRGFWGGHLFTGRLQERTMAALIGQYRELVSDAGRPESKILIPTFHGHGRDRLADHLRVAWLRGYTGFDALFQNFVHVVDDRTRANLVRQLASEFDGALKSEDEEWGRRVIDLLEAFWSNRISAMEDNSDSLPTEEASSFTFWLDYTPRSLSEIKNHLVVLVRSMNLGYEVEKLLAFLARRVQSDTSDVIDIIRLLVDRLISTEEPVWYIRELPPLIHSAAAATPTGEARRQLESVISDLLQYKSLDLRSAL